MKRIKFVEVYFGVLRVGRLAETNQGSCAFEYDADYLLRGKSISPFELPLKNGVFLAKQQPFNGNFGVFDDCMPDGWGLLILDRYLKKQGENLHTLSTLERLSLVGATGRGALEFRPDKSVVNDATSIQFETLASEIQKILNGGLYTGDAIEYLYKQGGSPGGARPKIFTQFEGEEWLVKFRSNQDPLNIGQIEYNYSLLAKKCGIEMPKTRLLDGKFFAVKRFDRTELGKLHVVSVAGLINADYRTPCLDYYTIFQLCQQLTQNMSEIWKLYRLMVFNYLIENKDDHAKNFSFILRNDEWQLSPAYDILPSIGFNGYHTTSINDNITPTKEDVIKVAVTSGLDKNKALGVFDEIYSIIHA